MEWATYCDPGPLAAELDAARIDLAQLWFWHRWWKSIRWLGARARLCKAISIASQSVEIVKFADPGRDIAVLVNALRPAEAEYLRHGPRPKYGGAHRSHPVDGL